MSTACQTPLSYLLCNTANNLTFTLTDAVSGAGVNGKAMTYALKTLDEATTIASGTATDTGSSGAYTVTITQAQAQEMDPDKKYLFILGISADGFEKRFTPTARYN